MALWHFTIIIIIIIMIRHDNLVHETCLLSLWQPTLCCCVKL